MDLIRDLRFRWRAARYGIDPVSSVYASAAFIDVADHDLKSRSFHISDNRFVRAIDADITQLVGLRMLKGSAWGLIWGVSLSFLPHQWHPEVRWHRTESSARFDLFEAPAMASERSATQIEKMTADGLHGEAYLRTDLTRLWRSCQNQILCWLDEVKSVEAVLAKARAQQTTEIYHSPPPGMIEVFALTRLGHEAEGRVRLERFIDESCFELECLAGLREAFEQVAQKTAR